MRTPPRAHSRRLLRVGAGFSLCALVLAGCVLGDDDEGGDAPGDAASEDAPSLPSYDPPLAFGDPSIEADVMDYAVEDGIFYGLYTEDSAGFDADTVSARYMANGDLVPGAGGELAGQDVAIRDWTGIVDVVRFVHTGDGLLLVHAYQYVQPDSEDVYIRVRAFDADGGDTAWTEDLEAWEWGFQPRLRLEADGEYLAVAYSDDSGRVASHALEAATGTPVWSSEDVLALGMHGDAVLAHSRSEDGTALSAVAVGSGETLWTLRGEGGLAPTPLGGGLLAVSQYQSEQNGFSTSIVDAESGGVLTAIESAAEPACVSDRESVVACSGPDLGIRAFDAASGALLWERESGSGGGLAAFHGVVYAGGTEEDGASSALDAATGEVLADRLPGVFSEVGPGYAIQDLDEPEDVGEPPALVSVFPATG